MKILPTFCLIICLPGLSLFAQSTQKKEGRIFIPTEPCYMAVEDLPPIMGLRFGMKMDEIKKIFKTARPKSFNNKQRAISDFDIYEIRGAEIARSPFKSSLQSVEFTHIKNQEVTERDGISSISLNFRPPAKAASLGLFLKINEELGLPGSYWLARDYGNTNYLQWDANCDGFSASVVIQPGFFARLSMFTSYGERQKSKPRRDGPVGE